MDNLKYILQQFELELQNWSPGPARRRCGISEKEHKWLKSNCQEYLDMLNLYLDTKNKKRYVSSKYYAENVSDVKSHKRIDVDKVREMLSGGWLPIGFGNLKDNDFKR